MLSLLPAQPEELARCPQKQKSDDVPFQKKLESATGQKRAWGLNMSCNERLGVLSERLVVGGNRGRTRERDLERSDLDCGLTSGAVDEGLCDRVTTEEKTGASGAGAEETDRTEEKTGGAAETGRAEEEAGKTARDDCEGVTSKVRAAKQRGVSQRHTTWRSSETVKWLQATDCIEEQRSGRRRDTVWKSGSGSSRNDC